MIILFIGFILLASLLAIFKPTYFVIFYILSATKFLGFFDIGVFVFGGTDLGFPILNLIALVSIIFKSQWYIVEKYDFKLITLFSIFLLYGIIYPLFMEFETTKEAIVASKDYWSIFFLIYLLVNKEIINTTVILNILKYLGLYLSFIYIIYLIVNIGPPTYVQETHIRTFFPTFISLSIFLFYKEHIEKEILKKKFIVYFSILFIGLILAGHFALTLSTLIMISFLNLFYLGKNISFSKFIIRGSSLFAIMFIILTFNSNLRTNIQNSIELVTSGKDVALSSRDIYNEFRWNAINDNPYFGYGFLHKDSQTTKSYRIIENNRFTEKFSVIDSGYVDLLIKFGIIGTIIYLILWLRIIIPILFRPREYNFLQLSLAAYIAQYFLVSLTWSVFTFIHGLIPAFIAILLITKKNNKDSNEK
ncbi:MAG: hypothetical protein CL624_04895 [Arcobacter sp.]|nr:hypothetical protein [Arcobacter sp.]|tara:strand:+ start:1601 stop:2857 length:1257 start_codon:yes stop_codon:yes gene_type:complete